jgi:hypothetical protein
MKNTFFGRAWVIFFLLIASSSHAGVIANFSRTLDRSQKIKHLQLLQHDLGLFARYDMSATPDAQLQNYLWTVDVLIENKFLKKPLPELLYQHFYGSDLNESQAVNLLRQSIQQDLFTSTTQFQLIFPLVSADANWKAALYNSSLLKAQIERMDPTRLDAESFDREFNQLTIATLAPDTNKSPRQRALAITISKFKLDTYITFLNDAINEPFLKGVNLPLERMIELLQSDLNPNDALIQSLQNFSLAVKSPTIAVPLKLGKSTAYNSLQSELDRHILRLSQMEFALSENQELIYSTYDEPFLDARKFLIEHIRNYLNKATNGPLLKATQALMKLYELPQAIVRSKTHDKALKHIEQIEALLPATTQNQQSIAALKQTLGDRELWVPFRIEETTEFFILETQAHINFKGQVGTKELADQINVVRFLLDYNHARLFRRNPLLTETNNFRKILRSCKEILSAL